MRYVPIAPGPAGAGGTDAAEPHVMVDGAPRAGTVLTLSHWPGTPTPAALWHDLSAGIVLEALARPGALAPDLAAATVDHLDTDGVVALALLCVPGLAAAHGPLLLEAARVGDFGVVRHRDAALVAFALEALAAAPGPGAEEPALARCARVAGEALRILPSLAEDPRAHAALWGPEARAYDAAEAALVGGWATVEELPEHDLAVVRVDTRHPGAGAAAWGGAPLHRAAVHSRTERLRVLTVAGGTVELRYRYESWVRLVSRRARPRVDLDALAARLTALEGAGTRWRFDGAGAITPALAPAHGARSTLDTARLVGELAAALAVLDAGPPAWDPGGMGGDGVRRPRRPRLASAPG